MAPLDLGNGYKLRFTAWRPDRSLNPQYDGIPDVDPYGAIITCPHGEGAITFAGEAQRRIEPTHAVWTIVSTDPLTLTPSIHNISCGCHGWIRAGKWVRA